MSDTHTHMENNHKHNSVAVQTPTPKSEVALREEAVLRFWEEQEIFKQSLQAPAGGAPVGDFVFYDGPPFATGLPHYGHILASTIKDAVPRFWTMQGYHVRRQWGWDCHGLPLENLIEKKLGLATKRDIEDYGVKNFNEAAREAVMEFADDWKRIIPRMGRWADMESDYKTMDSTYTESVWWVFSELHKKGLVFEGFKSMHLCPRCGTTLSNFEVNLGYKDIKDIAVTVKLKLDPGQQIGDFVTDDNTSLLVWTTTPWTLPGNMAAAIHQDGEYVIAYTGLISEIQEKENQVVNEKNFERVVIAKKNLNGYPARAEINGEIVYSLGGDQFLWPKNFIKGTDLVGKSYQPPFDAWQKQEFEGKENAWKIYHADYVELGEEGTGAVHLAPAYGDEDMQLAKQHDIPIMHHVDENGHFKQFVTDFNCALVKPKDDDAAQVSHLDTDIEVVKKLKENGKLFKKENITHSYPHCWRCDTPLLNYATTSWFVDVPKIKDDLVAENNKVHWVPEHVGQNRFGNWLEGARDWAVSRQRYWGAPLPIWRNPATGDFKVFGSLAELQAHVPKSGNQYLMMRHGESESNLAGIISARKENNDPLTPNGRAQVAASLAKLPEKIDLIVHSGFMRTKETAAAVAAAHPEATLIEDARIGELGLSAEFEGKHWGDYNAAFSSFEDRYERNLPGSENRRDAQVRMGQVLYELEATHKDKTILMVSHAGTLFALECAATGLDVAKAKEHFKEEAVYLTNAEVRALSFTSMPHNDNFELDFHRPYIDDVVVEEDGVRLVRVPDVFDCWFESGSMPYGQYHYPFEHSDEFEKKLFPANFIAEGLDQTRGWFYSLIVLGTALFGKSPFQNVIVNGLVLAEDGKKMSKKLQNYPDPMELADRVGVDAMRLYLLSAPIVRGEDLNFSENGVLDLQRKVIGRLHNVLAMYELYAVGENASSESTHVLDRWMLARLAQTTAEMTAGYKAYELDKATRPLIDLVDDLSVWYVRRSRDRLKGEDVADKAAALATLRYTLKHISLLMAPAMPFYADYLWGKIRHEGEAASVHLARWPEAAAIDPVVIGEMSIVRELVTLALEARTKAGVKVRQPLPVLHTSIELAPEYAAIVADEVNVKQVKPNVALTERIMLDTTITPELKAEGDAREFIRAVQDIRKQAGLEPSDRITLTIQTSDGGEAILRQFETDIKKTVGAESLTFGNATGNEVTAGEHSFTVELIKR